jgi:hypothetical protein
MLYKLKIIFSTFILFIFGFTLMTVSPVFAKGPSSDETTLDALNNCDMIDPINLKSKVSCFRNQAHNILIEHEMFLKTISVCVSNPKRKLAVGCVRDAMESEGERDPISADKGSRGRGPGTGK